MALETPSPVPALVPPATGADWLGLTEQPLPLDAASAWAVLARCGAVVTFSGTARDHSEGRPGVERLEYEAYEEHVVPRLRDIATEARRRWPDLGRLVLLHRIGVIPIAESAVVVVASAPHRAEAFEAARYGIDTLKESVPIWKREAWSGGRSWGLEPQAVTSVGATAPAPSKLSGVSGAEIEGTTLKVESRSMTVGAPVGGGPSSDGATATGGTSR